MASLNLQASPHFFKQLSLDCQHLKITLQTLETFAFRASTRGHELRDHRLLLILEQLEAFVLMAKRALENMEKSLYEVAN